MPRIETLKRALNPLNARETLRLIRAKKRERDLARLPMLRLRKLARKKADPSQPIKVGFLLQYIAVWDKMEDVYEEMCRRDDFEPVLIPIPDPGVSGWDDIAIEDMDRSSESYCTQNYPDRQTTPLFDQTHQAFNLQDLSLDYVFFQRQYDIKLPSSLRSDAVAEYAKICYIPYGYILAPIFEDMAIGDNMFADNVYFFFTDSKSQYDQINGHWQTHSAFRYQKIRNLGYPALSQYSTETSFNEHPNKILWTPRWATDSAIGGSHFLEYRNPTLETCKQGYELLVRPHPLMWEHLVAEGLLSSDDIDQYKLSIKEAGASISNGSSCRDDIRWSDVLITDFSSITIEYLLTGKPMIFCPPPFEVNEQMSEMLKGMYIASSWNEASSYLDMLKSGQDPKGEIRREIASSISDSAKHAATRICDEIAADHRGG